MEIAEFSQKPPENRLMIEHCVTSLTGLSNVYIHCCQLKLSASIIIQGDSILDQNANSISIILKGREYYEYVQIVQTYAEQEAEKEKLTGLSNFCTHCCQSKLPEST